MVIEPSLINFKLIEKFFILLYNIYKKKVGK